MFNVHTLQEEDKEDEEGEDEEDEEITFSKYSKGSGRPAPGSGIPSATSTSLQGERGENCLSSFSRKMPFGTQVD